MSDQGDGSTFLTTNNGKAVYCSSLSFMTPDGKRRFIRGFGATPEEAKRRRNRNIGRAATRKPKAPSKPKTPTVSEYAEIWLSEAEIQASTATKYREGISHIIQFTGNTQLSDLKSAELHDLFYKKLAGIGQSARETAFKVFNAMLNNAVNNDIIQINPLKKVKAPPREIVVAKDDERWITRRTSVAKGLIKWLSEPTNPYHEDYPRILFMMLGLRRGELLGLTWDCISNLNSKGKAILTIKQQLVRHETSEPLTGYYIKSLTKTPKGYRRLPLTEGWRQALLEQKRKGYQANREDFKDLIFLTPQGACVNPNTNGERWREILTAYWNKDRKIKKPLTKEEYFRPHAMRHISASILIEQGVPIEVVQEFLGHSSREMSRWYTHIGTEQKRKATDALGAVLKA